MHQDEVADEGDPSDCCRDQSREEHGHHGTRPGALSDPDGLRAWTVNGFGGHRSLLVLVAFTDLLSRYDGGFAIHRAAGLLGAGGLAMRGRIAGREGHVDSIVVLLFFDGLLMIISLRRPWTTVEHKLGFPPHVVKETRRTWLFQRHRPADHAIEQSREQDRAPCLQDAVRYPRSRSAHRLRGRYGVRTQEPTHMVLVVPACVLAMPRDVLRLFLINVRKRVARLCLRVQELIELRLDCLRVAVLGTLDEERHEPRGHGSDRVPVECLPLEEKPRQPVDGDDEERERVCRLNASLGQEMADCIYHWRMSIPNTPSQCAVLTSFCLPAWRPSLQPDR